ncbi:amidohydrolase family protein [Streptomyces sp. DvalAA-19]|uniref:metal-dependent hydrolase family protein n=1 Tax=Streptomyces sp. DvalAA-19 TaxID=1839761 RepID=UPI00081B45A3|nr:amidohydrolase family protein [Streptomyces sp. DvalAA-19]SCD59565.1 Imidazolonepropionase [Streptomyces sp. DvalAA-19]
MTQHRSVPPILVDDVRVFSAGDDADSALTEPTSVLIQDRSIAAIGGSAEPPPGTVVIEGGGRILMPGLSDAHVHLFAAGTTHAGLLNGPTGTNYYNALAEAERMLMRGFTTVRDMAGDVASLRQVLDSGMFPGPRVYPSQAAISQTSGHGDFSAVHEDASTFSCGLHPRSEQIGFFRVADGRDQVLAAVREQLKKGAAQIKIMAGGGVASAYDPLDVLQYTPDELRAAVEAAADWGTYVAAHVYNDEGIRRAIDAGIKSIEHGHLAAGRETVELMTSKGVWLSTQPFLESDHEYANPENTRKNKQVCDGVANTFAWARETGANIAFGTDLLLEPEKAGLQSEMLTRLSTHFGFSPAEALRIATSGNAALFRLSGERDPYKAHRLGVIEVGAWADVLLAEGDPTQDLTVLGDPDKNLAVIIKDGHIYKNLLG